MAGKINDPDVIQRVLTDKPRVAIVGLSANPERASNEVAEFLAARGFEIVPVNPGEDEILGRTCYASLDDIPGDIEVVDIFRKPDDVGPIVEAAIEKGARVVWMQLGIVNEEAARRASDAGLDVVMDHCMKREIKKRDS